MEGKIRGRFMVKVWERICFDRENEQLFPQQTHIISRIKNGF